MLLYGSTDSGNSYKVRPSLLLAGIPHRYERIDLGLARGERPSAFRSAAQFGEVPVLVNGGRAHWQHPDRAMRDDSTRADAGTNPGSLAHELP